MHIYIERVIGRLRKFNILNTIIPIKQAEILDDLMVSVAGLVNLNKCYTYVIIYVKNIMTELEK